jgi:all-trans-retinol 13,14-reductase
MEKYDFVIIGSGLGGLECAEILSREGYSVCVLEKNHQIGGNLQTFSRDKTIFDTGIHYIGGLDKGQNLYQYFKYLGIMDELKLKRLDMDGYDIITFDGDKNRYNFAQGYDRFIEELLRFFPNEREGLTKYCNKIREVCSSFPMYNLQSASKDPISFKYLDISAREFIESCVQDQKLRAVLAGSNALYAGEGDRTPLYVHALVTNTYIESSWRCVDGASQIARLLRGSINKNGGKVITHAEATKFHFDDDKIDSVELMNGELVRGKNFISNIHPAITMSMIEEGKVRKSYKKRIQQLENSTSVFILYIVLKENSLPYFNCNYYHYNHLRVWEGTKYTSKDWPNNYALFTGAQSKNSNYSDGLIMMTYMDFEDVSQWSSTFNTAKRASSRGEDYEDFKKKKAELMFNELEKKFPNIRNITKTYYTSSPLTLRDYIGSLNGSMYGYLKDYKNPIKSFVSAKTKVPNLYLTGQNLNLHGVLGVTIGAVVTCSEFIDNEYLMRKIKDA